MTGVVIARATTLVGARCSLSKSISKIAGGNTTTNTFAVVSTTVNRSIAMTTAETTVETSGMTTGSVIMKTIDAAIVMSVDSL